MIRQAKHTSHIFLAVGWFRTLSIKINKLLNLKYLILIITYIMPGIYKPHTLYHILQYR